MTSTANRKKSGLCSFDANQCPDASKTAEVLSPSREESKSRPDKEARLYAQYEREVENAVAAKIEVALSAERQEMNEKFVIAERETRARLEAEIHQQVRKGVFDTHNLAAWPTNGGQIIVSDLSKLGDVWSVILAVKLSRSPYRTISNPYVGNPSRAFLGENGTLEVHVNIPTMTRRAVYYDNMRNVKFMAECPNLQPYNVIQGNAGREPLFVWDAVNEAHASGGTTIRGGEGGHAPGHRRFFFHFATNATLAVTLYHIMYGKQNFTEEFFYPEQGTRNRFLKTLNLPAHKVVSTAINMNSRNIRRLPVNTLLLTRKHNGVDPTGESQAM